MRQEYLKQKKILLADDEEALLGMVETIFREGGFTEIMTAATAAEALEKAETQKPDFAVLDVMFPDGDGFSLLSRIRQRSDIPVLFLTARGEDEDRLKGLGLGADDYMVKPFLPQELLLRTENILKRYYRGENPVFRIDGGEIDLQRAEVHRGGIVFPLTAKEHDILAALCRNAGRIVSIDQLCEAAWGDNPYGYENSLMAHIRRIREKIEENPSKPVTLITVKGLGYRLIPREQKEDGNERKAGNGENVGNTGNGGNAGKGDGGR